MSKLANRPLIGAFVLGALALAVAGVVFFGSGKFLRKVYKDVMFFEGSVKGLQIGAPVMFRGVQIGHVTNVVLQVNVKDLTAFIPVYVEIYPQKMVMIGGVQKIGQMDLPTLIENGLRAQLQLQSFVTGQLVVDLDFYPNTPIRLVGLEKEYPEIPTIPSDVEQLRKKLESLPINEIAERLNEALAGINRLVNSRDLRESIGSLNQSLKDADALVNNLNTKIAPQIASNIKETLSAAQDTLRETSNAVKNINGIAAKNANLGYEIDRTLEQIAELSRSIRVLADYLERHPEALLRGKSPAKGD